MLEPPSLHRLLSYLGFLDELRAAGDTVWPGRVALPGEDDAAFVARLVQLADPAHAQPTTVRWGVVDDAVVGVIVLRHHLTPALARYGGHVSYEVRPSARRRGLGTALLLALLQTPEARALGTLRVTCAPDNVGSRRIIEACGGRLLDVVHVEDIARDTCRYDLPVPSSAMLVALRSAT